jgi:hypothetical protein
VVLSGLLAAQGRTALAIYRARGLVLTHRIPLEGWVTLVLRAPSGSLRGKRRRASAAVAARARGQ